FRLAAASIQGRVGEIVASDRAYGRAEPGRRQKIQVEFVSANPTGPLHVAHGRGAALGDAIAALLEHVGFDVHREFYVNDAGVQIDRLAESLEARWLEVTGTPTPIPEGGYHGEYLRDMAAEGGREVGDPPGALARGDGYADADPGGRLPRRVPARHGRRGRA